MNTGDDAFIPAGKVIKVHGLNGELVVDPDLDFPEQLEEQNLFYVNNKRGDRIPVRVESSRLQRKGSRISFFVKFVQITDRNEAESLRGQTLYLYAETVRPADDGNTDPFAYIGYRVRSEDGDDYGEVQDILDNPAHPILEVSGAYGRFMIPVVDFYVKEIDEKKRQVTGRNLENLTGL